MNMMCNPVRICLKLKEVTIIGSEDNIAVVTPHCNNLVIAGFGVNHKETSWWMVVDNCRKVSQ